MKAWKQSDYTSFTFSDAHDLNYAFDSSQRESILAQLRTRFDSSKTFVILIGDRTRLLRKFVPWEIDQAISRKLPIICVNLSNLREMDSQRCPDKLKVALAIHIPFGQKILEYALDNWPASAESHRKAGQTGPFHFKPEVYTRLGL